MSPTLSLQSGTSSASAAPRSPQAALLEQLILDAIADPSAAPLDKLFVAVHTYQWHHAPVVRALTAGNGPATHWTQIPAVPIALYKELAVGTLAADAPCVTFRTSGTTGGGRGVQRLRDTRLYDANAIAWARACLHGVPTDVVALLNDAQESPDSSLSHMVALFPTGLGAAGSVSWHLPNGRLDRDDLRARLATASGPVFVCATAFALADWLDSSPAPLPAGSWLMVTGGFKGHAVSYDDDALFAAARARLTPARLVTEYGMTELSSQLWGEPNGPYAAPPWLRVVAVDPVSGVALPVDQPGQLRFFDLCNLDASIGVETMDLGAVHADGRVTLHGRLDGAPARGCSLTVEEAWGDDR